MQGYLQKIHVSILKIIFNYEKDVEVNSIYHWFCR